MTTKSTSPAPPELILVMDPQIRPRVSKGKLVELENSPDGPLLQNLLHSQQATIEPVFDAGEEFTIYPEARPRSLEGGAKQSDLSAFYKITAPASELEYLASDLRGFSFVKSAYLKPGVELAFIDRGQPHRNFSSDGLPTDDFTRRQEYLRKAVEGIDARYAWTKNGGRGRNVKLIDVEGAWRFSHEDLAENSSGCVGGVPVADHSWRKHGTAVLGMLGGDHNSFGIAGICPDADVNTVSVFANAEGKPAPRWGSAAAIKLAADMLGPGDILLIELHLPGPAWGFEERDDQLGYIPVEWWPCNMAAIKHAVSRGIIVVEAGGNGEERLDKDIYNKSPLAPHGPFPPDWINPFNRELNDIGTILVGAGAPPQGIHNSDYGVDRSRLTFSNFGNAIDVQGWGEEVATCGGNNDLNPQSGSEDRHYTQVFNGTSSGAAMVAGAVACLQGALKAKGRLLTSRQLRDLLRDDRFGSPQQPDKFAPVSQRIGPRPDLRKLIDHVLSPCLLVRVLRRLKKVFLARSLSGPSRVCR